MAEGVRSGRAQPQGAPLGTAAREPEHTPVDTLYGGVEQATVSFQQL